MGLAAGSIRNPNHPPKGSTIRVEPVRTEKDIRLIKKHLAENPRDLCIFTVGINTNLRASDLLRITIGQVLHLQPGQHFTVKEKKTGKLRDITVNNTVHAAIQNLLLTLDVSRPDDCLFQSKKRKGQITEEHLNYMVKCWCREINLKGNYGAHTLRKTFGYIHRTRFGTDIPTLMTMFNHSTQRQTLAYLCIQPTEIKDAYLREI